MSDEILDDIDVMLEGEMSPEDTNFNESELQDIMAEIEDLEKEFIAEPETDSSDTMSLQEKIDAEMSETIKDEPVIAEAPVAKVLKIEKPIPVSTPVATSNSEVGFSAQGQMSLNLDFKVGSESAKLCIDPVKGLVVNVSGVEICISEDNGCTLSMENGMTFTIPLSSQEKSLKKKAA